MVLDSRRPWTHICGAILLTAFVGCAGRVANQGDNGERFIAEGWVLGDTRPAIRNRIGPPLGIRIESVKNQHDPDQTDERHEFRYEGLSLAFYVVKTVPEREFLTDISVTSARYALGWGLRVGDLKDEVIRRLGGNFTALRKPDLRSWTPPAEPECEDDPCTYRYTDHVTGESHVYVSFRNARVIRIDWVFWVD